METKDSVPVGTQVGDKEADFHVGPYDSALRFLLHRFCKGPYSDEIDEFAFLHRIQGKIWNWNLEGCHRMRLMKKHRYISIDVYFPQEKWREASGNDIKIFMIKYFSEGLDMMINKVKKAKIDLDEKKLRDDFSKAIRKFQEIKINMIPPDKDDAFQSAYIQRLREKIFSLPD